MRRAGTVGLALTAALMLGACRDRISAPVPPPEPPPLIERAALFSDPERTQPRVSPDGAYVSYLAPLNGVLNVFVAPAGDLARARPLTQETARGVREHLWAENGRTILYLRDEAGDENWRLHAIDVATGETRALTPPRGVQARIVATSPQEPNVVLVALNERDKSWHDVFRIDVITGERTLVLRNDRRFASIIADRDNQVRLATRRLDDGAIEVWRVGLDPAWEPLLAAPFEDSRSFQIIGFEADGRTVLAIDSAGRDAAALVRIDAASGQRTVLGESPNADVRDVWIDPVSRAPEAFAAEYLKPDWTPLTDEARTDLAFLRERLAEPFTVVSRTNDDRLWVVQESGPTRPGRAYLYDRPARTLRVLFDQRPTLADAPLTPMIPLEIPARDGLTLVAYLTLPPGMDADGNGRPDRPLPLVMVVHGGPWARDGFGFRADHQWLANRGYAALSVNFRGSTGFGKAFLNAGNLEWGAKMQDDLADALAWAVEQGVAAPGRAALMGASYGGYATLAGLAFTPDAWACGISLVGPSNLETLLEAIPPYWAPIRTEFARRMGDLATEEGRALLRARSPLHKAGDIRKPLLIAQGANDPRVPRRESDQIVAALASRDIPVTYLLYPDEGHGLAQPGNRIAFYAVAETFLGQCLGGRVEPLGEALAASSVQVLEGAELIPGLPPPSSP